MNLNEACLLRYLIEPDEIQELSIFFVKNIEETAQNQKSDYNIY